MARASGSPPWVESDVDCVYFTGNNRTPGATPANVVSGLPCAPTIPAANVPRPSQSAAGPPPGNRLISGRTWPAANWALAGSTPVPTIATVTPEPVVNGQIRGASTNFCAHGVAPVYTPLGVLQPAATADGAARDPASTRTTRANRLTTEPTTSP